MDSTARLAFRDPVHVFVKVTSGGFLIGERSCESLCGSVARVYLIRKRFEEGQLVCASSDGIRSREGHLCAECAHPGCRPRLRLCLRNLDTIYVLDLASSSAKNLLALEDNLISEGRSLQWSRLRLTVLDRGYWGEVRFEELTE